MTASPQVRWIITYTGDALEEPLMPSKPTPPSGTSSANMEKDLTQARESMRSNLLSHHNEAIRMLEMGSEESVTVDQDNYARLTSADEWIKSNHYYYERY